MVNNFVIVRHDALKVGYDLVVPAAACFYDLYRVLLGRVELANHLLVDIRKHNMIPRLDLVVRTFIYAGQWRNAPRRGERL